MNYAALLLVVLAAVLVADLVVWIAYARSWLGAVGSLGAVWLASALHRWAWR